MTRRKRSTTTSPPRTGKDANRKYYGCRHCGSLLLKSLSTCIGDPEGIRSDYQCRVCGGVFGTCKSGWTQLQESEWEEYHSNKMPRPNPERVAAMTLLISLEENFHFRFRTSEAQVAEIVANWLASHRKNLIQKLAVESERIRKVLAALGRS